MGIFRKTKIKNINWEVLKIWVFSIKIIEKEKEVSFNSIGDKEKSHLIIVACHVIVTYALEENILLIL